MSGLVSKVLSGGGVPGQVVRGLVGLVALGAAIWISGLHQPWSLAALIGLAAVALAAWRGCPTCWLMGLVAAMDTRRRKRSPR
jgi:hypothetical protein